MATLSRICPTQVPSAAAAAAYTRDWFCSGGMYRGSVDHTGKLLTAIFPEDDPHGTGGGILDEFQGTF
jgi:hypothetical protein